ncbi:MAG: energy-coupling factor ABC transporter ATP-binding protein, partial [Pseudomonadota bacterium]
MSAPSLFTFKYIRKRISDRLLIDVDEIALQSGQFTLLRGDNGSGKSTLLKIMAGLLTPDGMTVVNRGEKLVARRIAAQLRQHVVYLHQDPYLFDCSVARNIAYGLLRRGRGGDDIQHQVNETLEWAGLAHLAQRDSHQLSGGEKQRVALMRAHVCQPAVILLDEPTAGMDKSARESTIDLIKKS